jgi:hypothetical protein
MQRAKAGQSDAVPHVDALAGLCRGSHGCQIGVTQTSTMASDLQAGGRTDMQVVPRDVCRASGVDDTEMWQCREVDKL